MVFGIAGEEEAVHAGFGVEVVDGDEVFIMEYDYGGIVFLGVGDIDSKARTAVEDRVG
jgi:hypothetical protein